MEKPGNQHQERRERVSHTEDIENRDRAAENSGKKQEGWNREGIGEGPTAWPAKKADEENDVGEICRQGHQQRGQQGLMVGGDRAESPTPAQDYGHNLRGDLREDGEDESLNGCAAGGR